MFDHEEFERWIAQAEYTLKSAENDLNSNMAYGHSIKKLFDILSRETEEVTVPEEIFDSARLLDRHYIPPRYPDAYIEGAPYEYYGKKDAIEAINAAKRIISFVRGVSDGLR